LATEMTAVMFTDLVDSTALMSSLGEAAGDGLRREHFTLLRAAIAASGGREVKNLGDGIMAAFQSASDAVRAAMEVQRSAARRNRRATHSLSIRVGISLGDADVEDGDYFGPPVVQAARLCARAGGGEILVADVVRLLAGTRAECQFELVGDLDLKGLDALLTTWRVSWVVDEATLERPALPARLVSARVPHFVGRSDEYQHLWSAWKSACVDGRRRVMLLAGEPGIGKTTLAARLASAAHDAGAVVVYGRCDEDLGVVYQPWLEALTQLVAWAPEAVLRAHVTDRGGQVARLVPTLRGRTGVEPPAPAGDDDRSILFGGVIDLLERVSVETPLLVVLDDLHWADRATLQLLRQLVVADRPMRVGVLGTFRDSDVADGDPLSELLAALHRERGVDRLALRGLSDADLLAWLEATAGHEMDAAGVALRDALLAETAGNPFFVGEVLRHLAEAGAIYRTDSGRWVGLMDLQAVGLPVSVKEVVGRRLVALGRDAQRVLALAAVIGRDFDVGLLATVAQVDEDEVIDLCDAAVAAAVLQTTDRADRYTFAHALIEHTLYVGLSPARRARAHRAVAEAIESVARPDDAERVGELAHHWNAAGEPTASVKALHYAELAGAASAELAPEESMRWYEQALDLVDRMPGEASEPRRGVRLLLGLGDAQRRCGDSRFRRTLLAAARRADEVQAVDLQVRAVLANNRGFWSDIGGSDAERIEAIERALERLGADAHAHHADHARLLALLAVEQYFQSPLECRERLADEAISIARIDGDPAVLSEVLYRSEVGVRSATNLAKRRAWMDEASALADVKLAPGVGFNIHANAAVVALEAADPVAISRHRTICGEIVERTPHAQWRWEHTYDLVVDSVLSGDLEGAERLAQMALDFGIKTGQDNADLIFGTQLVAIRYHQGRVHEMIPFIEAAFHETPSLTGVRETLALCCARTHETARATELLSQLVADLPGRLPDFNFVYACACIAEAAVVVGRVDAVRPVRDVLVPYHSHLVSGGVTVFPAVAHYVGLLDAFLGRHDDAEVWFGEAVAIAERMSSPMLAAHTQAAWAQMLAERAGPGDGEHAADLAAASLDTATELGMSSVATDSRTVLNVLRA
jgi:class 3 adenylate cyclase/tetratricopeptide (TPR) repeat protein